MIKDINRGLKLQVGSDGSEKLIIDSSRIEECIKFIFESNIKSITINTFQGYTGTDIEFLHRLSSVLEGLHLPETKFHYNVVNSLHKLKFLGIADNGRDTIELSNFPDLENLACDYSPRLKGLDTSKKLKYLTLTGYKSKDKNLNNLPLLDSLVELNLFKSDIFSLQGVERQSRLIKFEIYGAPKLESIKAIALLNLLEEFIVEKCKGISDYESIKDLRNLKKLIISESGEIKTLSFLKSINKLEFISFWGTNILDGNLSYCEGLNYVGFDNRKHYSHKVEQFK